MWADRNQSGLTFPKQIRNRYDLQESAKVNNALVRTLGAFVALSATELTVLNDLAQTAQGVCPHPPG